MSNERFEQRLREALHREAYWPPLQLDSATLRERLAERGRQPALRLLPVAAALTGLAVLAVILGPRLAPILTPSLPSPAACETSELTQHGSWWKEAGGANAFFHLDTTTLAASPGSTTYPLIVRFDPDAEGAGQVAVWAERLEDGMRVDGVYNSPITPEGIGRFEETAPRLPGGWYLFEQRLPLGGCWRLTAAIGDAAVGTATVSVVGPTTTDGPEPREFTVNVPEQPDPVTLVDETGSVDQVVVGAPDELIARLWKGRAQMVVANPDGDQRRLSVVFGYGYCADGPRLTLANQGDDVRLVLRESPPCEQIAIAHPLTLHLSEDLDAADVILERVTTPTAPDAVRDAVEGLFAETTECHVELAGHTVTITYPVTWSTNEASGDDFLACIWFAPEPIELPVPLATRPAGVAITFGSAGGPFGSWSTPALAADVTIAGREAIRVEELGGASTEGDGLPQLVYQIALGETPTDGPTLVAVTSEEDFGDYGLNRAVLDRMMALLTIE